MKPSEKQADDVMIQADDYGKVFLVTMDDKDTKNFFDKCKKRFLTQEVYVTVRHNHEIAYQVNHSLNAQVGTRDMHRGYFPIAVGTTWFWNMTIRSIKVIDLAEHPFCRLRPFCIKETALGQVYKVKLQYFDEQTHLYTDVMEWVYLMVLPENHILLQFEGKSTYNRFQIPPDKWKIQQWSAFPDLISMNIGSEGEIINSNNARITEVRFTQIGYTAFPKLEQ